jgi:hypothetical protein
VRGQQPDGVAAVGARCDGVGGQVLAEHVVQEHLGARAGEAVDEAGRRVEQHHHRVQVAVGRLGPPLARPAALAAGFGRGAPGAQRVPPVGETAGPPHRPQHLLGGGARRRGGLPGGGDQPGDGLRGQRPAALHQVQAGGVAQRVDQQLTGRPPVAGRQRQRAQPLPEPPLGQRVGAAQRRVQQRDGRLLVQGVRLQRAPEQQQERRDRRLQVKRQVFGVGHGRHAGSGERPLQRGQLQRRGAQQHGHPRPRHAVQQVRLTQHVRDVGGLAGRRPERPHDRPGRKRLGGRGRQGAGGGSAAGGGGGGRPGEGRPGGGRLGGRGRVIGGRRDRWRVQRPVRDRAAHPPRHPAGRLQQRRLAAVAGVQRHRLGQRAGGGAEAEREVRHRIGVGAAEAVHRGVRVAERDQRLAAAGDQGQQLDLGRVGVGELVDVDVRQAVAFRLEQRGIVGQQAGRGAHELGGVVGGGAAGGGVAQGHDRDVLPDEPRRGRPVVAAQPLAEPGELDRAHAALRGPLHEVAELLGERAGGQRRPQRVRPADRVAGLLIADDREQLADDQVLLGTGEQARGRLAALGGGAAEQAERVRMEGPHQRLVHDAAGVAGDPRLDPVAQRRGAAAAEREHQDAFRVGAVGDPGGDRLDQQRRLAGAGAADDQQRAVGVIDDVPLEGVDAQRGHRRPAVPDQAVGRATHGRGRHRDVHGVNDTTGVRRVRTAASLVRRVGFLLVRATGRRHRIRVGRVRFLLVRTTRRRRPR